jgi:hypothetical protein
MAFSPSALSAHIGKLLSPSASPKSHQTLKEFDPLESITLTQLTERLERRWGTERKPFRRKQHEDERDADTTTAEAKILKDRRDLRERDVHTRYHAIENLAKHGNTCSDLQKDFVVQDLCDVLRRDRSALVRKSAVFALGEMGADSAARDLRHAARCDEDQFVRKEALQVLEMMGFFTDMIVPTNSSDANKSEPEVLTITV